MPQFQVAGYKAIAYSGPQPSYRLLIYLFRDPGATVTIGEIKFHDDPCSVRPAVFDATQNRVLISLPTTSIGGILSMLRDGLRVGALDLQFDAQTSAASLGTANIS